MLGRRVAGGLALGFASLALLAGAAYYVIADGGTCDPRRASRRRRRCRGRACSSAARASRASQLGDTEAEVRALLGPGLRPLLRTATVKTWLYLYPTGDPFGAGVRFRDGRVIAVFTLGAPTGWRDDEGVRVGQLLEPQEPGEGDETWRGCLGLRREVEARRRGGVVGAHAGPRGVRLRADAAVGARLPVARETGFPEPFVCAAAADVKASLHGFRRNCFPRGPASFTRGGPPVRRTCQTFT